MQAVVLVELKIDNKLKIAYCTCTNLEGMFNVNISFSKLTYNQCSGADPGFSEEESESVVV